MVYLSSDFPEFNPVEYGSSSYLSVPSVKGDNIAQYTHIVAGYLLTVMYPRYRVIVFFLDSLVRSDYASHSFGYRVSHLSAD